MTFKHEKLEDSPTMRSLIKVAEQKGWIKNEPIKKTASIESFDLSPTYSLTENVLKLCSGLRKSGMDKYADEVESKFIAYKRAAEIYDVSKEKGEDLVDAAHPDGSHQLEGVSGDALIETIVDRHLKMLDVVDKKPTGKTAQSIINSVRLVLAQTTDNSEAINSFNSQIAGLMNKLVETIEKIKKIGVNQLSFQDTTLRNLELVIVLSKNPTLDNLSEIKSLFNTIYSRLKPGIFGGITEDTWADLQGLFNLGKSYIAGAIVLREKLKKLTSMSLSQEVDSPSNTVVKPTSNVSDQSIGQSLDKILSRLNSFKAVISNKKIDNRTKAQGLKWVNDNINETEGYKTQFNNELAASVEDVDKNRVISKYTTIVGKLSGEVNQFYNDWIVS